MQRMSHPDPHHDQENERADDDLLRDEIDARRREDDLAAQAEQREQDKINAYADAMIRRDKIERPRQVYENNGWLYGVADRPGYSDTPKDRNK